MRQIITRIVLLCFTANQSAIFAAPADEAAAAAAGANVTIEGFVSTPSASSVVPGYTTSPPEAAHYGTPNLSPAANARVSECTGSEDPACQATTTGVNSALAPKPQLGPYDSAIAGVRDIANNPTSILGDLSPYYSGCTTTNLTSGPTLESKKCNRYAALGNVRCSSKLIGELATTPSCAPGTWVPAGTAHRNGADVMQVEAYCDPARKDGRQAFRFYAHGGEGACIDWQSAELDTAGVPTFKVLASLSPHWEGSCRKSFYVAVAPSAGCSAGTCNYTFKFGAPTRDASGAITDVGPWSVASSFAAPRGSTAIANTWDNQCAALEANSGFGACTRVSGPSCVDGPSTKTIQGHDVAAACWEYQSSYNCGIGGTPDECAPLAAQGCVKTATTCRQAVPGDPETCGIFQDTYQCRKAAQTTSTVSNCGPSTCTTAPQLISPAVYDTQSCFTYLSRSLSNPCAKSLDVAVSWTCPAGSTSGPTRNGAPPGKGTWTCLKPQPQPYCAPPLTGPSISGTPPNAGLNVCTDPNTGAESAAPTRPIDAVVSAIPHETDSWANGCAGFEARVPPGLLPPDGQLSPAPGPIGSGPLDKCERAGSTCTQSSETRIVNDHSVTRNCWAWANTFNCVGRDAKSDCDQPRSGQCTQSGQPKCVDSDMSLSPPVCTAWRTDFQCKVKDAVFKNVTDCGAEQPPADADFLRTVTFMEAGREAGRYLDPTSLRVFKGADNRCDKRLFGITNCCKGGGGGTGSLLNNASMASTASTAYNTAFSTYTYDALFVSDAPQWVLTAFDALSGTTTGFSSALAGVAAGDISFMTFLSSLSVFTWIAIVIFIIQISGILDCPENAQVTAIKRDARLCADIGEYCSSKLAVIGTCVTRTHTYCCFNSRLSRMINEQGRKQLGLGWGSAEHPRCDGFTIEDLQSLNFAAMDLSEFYAEIVPTMPNVSSAVAKQQGRVQKCYFGQGRC